MNKAFLFLFVFYLSTNTVLAQTVQSVSNRVDRMEMALEQVQKKLSNNYVGATKRPSSAGETISDDKLDVMLIQIQETQDTLRQLTGEMETIRFRQDEIQSNIDKINADISLRFSDLEKKVQAYEKVINEQNAEKLAMQKAKLAEIEKQKAEQEKIQKAQKAELDKKNKEKEQRYAYIKKTYGNMKPKDIYDAGFAAIRKQHYITAKSKFEAFLTLHPKDELAGNAQYWLGESFFARSMLNDAAIAFAEGYQKYHNSPKAPDNLFKLGVTMSKLKKNKEACIAFKSFKKEYPEVASSMKTRLAKEMKTAACQ